MQHKSFHSNSSDYIHPPLNQIDKIVSRSIASGSYPGAVIWASHQGKIIYQGIFGNRRVEPDVAGMQFDTIFDLASLTKVVVTTTAIMQLVEQEKITLHAPLHSYWPAFSGHGKENITIKELLTHTAGFPAIVPKSKLSNKENILKWVAQSELSFIPNTHFLYSDIGLLALGYLVERITGQSLDHYAQAYIFGPLGMYDTQFLPPATLRDRIAPTEMINGHLRRGTVHDPTATAMGGVSGLAGLFSTARDLGVFLDCILAGGRIPDQYADQASPRHILLPSSVQQMTTVQTPAIIPEKRGLGWDIHSMPYDGGRGKLFSPYAFGHTGFTGTSMWVDPVTTSWVIILTSRVHPVYHPNDTQLFKDRSAIADIIAGNIGNIVK
ncbi:serine hydrolase domain-containing protein [Cardinium endosymbiont of Nabis limbatus]|uniref:serine hydrolase domain-containing protein n=1 Tax=Cardinium endosymbiont of Nabis limbatus TaxID=3066217 RepID=UPI003AF34B88